MIRVTRDGKILYRASKAQCLPFPITGNEDLLAGMRRNYEVFDPLDFLAEVTQHIPNKGEHQIRYYGWYSNKKRGMREKQKPVQAARLPEPDTAFSQKRRMTWAALIKCVYEVNPLKCPTCGGTMKIVSFIDQDEVIEKILKHTKLWKEPPLRAPPIQVSAPPVPEKCILDYAFFEKTCI